MKKQSEIFKGGSVIFDDNNKYALKKYYKELKDQGYNIIVLNLNELNQGEGYNLLTYPYYLYHKGLIDECHEELEKIGNALYQIPDNSDPFWTYTAKDYFLGLALSLIMQGNEEEVNFNSILHMAMIGEDKFSASTSYINEFYNMKDDLSSDKIYVSSVINAPKETRGSIVSVFKQIIKLYVTRTNISNFLSKTTFDLLSVKNDNTAVFIIGKDDFRNGIKNVIIEQLQSINPSLSVLIEPNEPEENNYIEIENNINNEEIKIFNIKEYVMKIKREKINNCMKPIDDIIKNIDRKIDDLENQEKETKKGLPKNPFDDNRVLTFEEFMIYKELTNNKPFMMSKKDFLELIPNYKILQLSINKILTNAKEKEEINALMDEYYKELVNIMYYGKK